MYKIYNDYCNQLQYIEKYRQLPDLTQDLTKNQCIDFASNDYLGLSKRSELLNAAKLSGKQYGVGATGSRLLSGNKQLFVDLENQIAKDKNTEAALIFNSGFQANITVLSSLLDPKVLNSKPMVFFDQLNHSSLYQAAFLSGVKLIRYKHNDMEHLNKLLIKFKDFAKIKFIVTETVFGMDGDLLPIQQIVDLAQKHHAFLYLDEAHATGIFGNHGYGLSTNIDLQSIPHVIMGTFSKALGCCGAYIASSRSIKNYLINKAPGFIYSTALSPMIIGAATTAWELIKSLTQERHNLLLKAANLRIILQNLGFNIGTSESHIIPIILGSESNVLNAKQKLLNQNIIVSGLRPPTVLPNTSRLRIALNINHTDDHINYLISSLQQL